jgi:antitoxin component of MazEF toxin-antitoxin module
MPNHVKVRKWGNSLGLRLPKSFALQHAIIDGTTVEIDSLKIVDSTQCRRSRYRVKDLLNHYAKPPKTLDFPPAGKEIV